MRILLAASTTGLSCAAKRVALIEAALTGEGHRVQYPVTGLDQVQVDSAPDVLLAFDFHSLLLAAGTYPAIPAVGYVSAPCIIPNQLSGRRLLAVYPGIDTEERSLCDNSWIKTVIPPPVDLSTSLFPGPDSGKVITTTGPFLSGAGHRTLIRALSLLPEEYSAVVSGEEADYTASDIGRLAEDFGVGHRVKVTASNIGYTGAVAVAPSLSGEWVFESAGVLMAAGIPLLASSAGCHRDIVTDGVTGLFHTAGNHRQLAGQINHIMGNSGLCSYLSGNAVEYCRSELSTEAVGKKWTAELEQLCFR